MSNFKPGDLVLFTHKSNKKYHRHTVTKNNIYVVSNIGTLRGNKKSTWLTVLDDRGKDMDFLKEDFIKVKNKKAVKILFGGKNENAI